MLCRNPFVRDRKGDVFASSNPRAWLDGVPFGCGKCLACRVKKRRDWTTRLALEMLQHQEGCFLTLTYDEDHVPWSFDSRSLDKTDLQKFMKRFRRNLEKYKGRSCPVRFYACGEYGSRGTERPHYHIVIFGVSDMDFDVISAVDAAWREPGKGGLGPGRSLGIWTLDPLNEKRIAYVAGYVMKKLIKPTRHYCVKNGKRLLDRGASQRDEHGTLSEFRLMSRRPGLGAGFVADIVALWQSSSAFRNALTKNGDVPSVIRHLGKNYFLDRFIKQKLRDALGIEYDPTVYYAEVRKEFFDWLFDTKLDHSENFVDYLVHKDDQRFKQLQDRIKRQLQRRSKI